MDRYGKYDKIHKMLFFKIDGTYEENKLLYDLINHWIYKNEKDDGYFAKYNANLLTRLLAFLFIILDDENTQYLNNIDLVIDSLYK